jgi:Ni/Co efflux regulator RcnB
MRLSRRLSSSRKTLIMKTLVLAIAASALIAGGVANAAPGPSAHFHRGQHMARNDWAAAQPVDYRQHHLRKPPRGYEWRESNGQFILAAVATGVIASIILDSGH